MSTSALLAYTSTSNHQDIGQTLTVTLNTMYSASLITLVAGILHIFRPTRLLNQLMLFSGLFGAIAAVLFASFLDEDVLYKLLALALVYPFIKIYLASK
jgi:ABC-type antimicrobial peptide transport system permease subunit